MAAKSLTASKLLITGASGFTGRHACAHFVRQGYTVIAAGRNEQALQTIPGVTPFVCHLEDRSQVEDLIQQILPHYILHVAGKNSASDSWKFPTEYMESNVMAAVYVLEAVRKYCPGSRLVMVGSRLSTDPAKGAAAVPHPYSLSKTFASWVATAWQSLYQQPVILAEPSNLIGPGESAGFCTLLAKYIARYEAGRAVPEFRISSRFESRDFLDVRDAVAAYDVLLREGKPGMSYSIQSGVEHTLGELAQALTALAQIAVPVDYGPSEARLTPDSLNKGANGASGAEHLTELGWYPHFALEQSLADIMQYAREQAQQPSS
ncbi:NAD-dependent epimerase/dehydratase family protein [Paenibacillus sp. JCM 10914]|uniref:NAD-dependent epimerase/dehydratase family protein n=1 Tax=Paenibacillus sp. JCM 10914 TaxID=1236974 RepID=UPI0003CC39F2|nr:SDR family NAD(P)-dependent oxidoreductase [Paenibacillus sp. JCM 10914]GAE07540.1 NAD-dependent epimerase [Paenibacillus sp. JCM 10914]